MPDDHETFKPAEFRLPRIADDLAEVYVRIEYQEQVHQVELRCSDSLRSSFIHSLLTEAVEQVREQLNEAQTAKWKAAERAELALDAPRLPQGRPAQTRSPIVPGKWYREHTAQQLRAECDRRGVEVPRDVGNDISKLADLLNRDDRLPPSGSPSTTKCRAVVTRGTAKIRRPCHHSLNTDGTCPNEANHVRPDSEVANSEPPLGVKQSDDDLF